MDCDFHRLLLYQIQLQRFFESNYLWLRRARFDFIFSSIQDLAGAFTPPPVSPVFLRPLVRPRRNYRRNLSQGEGIIGKLYQGAFILLQEVRNQFRPDRNFKLYQVSIQSNRTASTSASAFIYAAFHSEFLPQVPIHSLAILTITYLRYFSSTDLTSGLAQ